MNKLSALVIMGILAGTPAVAGTLVRLDHPEPYDLQRQGFELSRPTEVRIEAVGIRDGGSDLLPLRAWAAGRRPMLVYAWILDGRTREPVWTLEDETAETTVSLDPGRYEVYFYSGAESRLAVPDETRREKRWWWERLIEGVHSRASLSRADLDACHVTLSAEGESVRFDPDGALASALIGHTRVASSRLETAGFALSAAASLRLYGAFEQLDGDEPADFGWIVNETTREVVWQADRFGARPAGGAEKNRLVDEQIRLDAGRYLLYYGTDDSHAFERFNAAPPHDPLHWGISLLPGDGFEPAVFKPFQPGAWEPTLIDLSQVGDRARLERAFRLTRDGRLYLRAMGEFAGGDFADRAWIVETATGRTVWQMTKQNTMAAGGANKNRMFDGVVELPRGDYVLHYSADGSHAYGAWNAAAPFDPQAWGVVLRPAPGFDAAHFEAADRS